jgi:hypothetical protein
VTEGLSSKDRRFLAEWSSPYALMERARKREFESQVARFLKERRITGVSVEIDRDDALLVAASACTLSCGWPGYAWDVVTEVLLYEEEFDRDYRVGRSAGTGDDEHDDGDIRVGETHAWGTIILSIPALDDSFDDPADGFHVGYHEFAHALANEGDGGLPMAIREDHGRALYRALQAARQSLESERSPLDPYGLESDAEMWAVAVESYFEEPSEVRRAHPDLFESLSRFFAWIPPDASSP